MITAKLKHRSEGNRLSVSLVIDFPREYLSNDYHGSLMALLTDIRKELQEDIVLSPVN